MNSLAHELPLPAKRGEGRGEGCCHMRKSEHCADPLSPALSPLRGARELNAEPGEPCEGVESRARRVMRVR